MATPTDYEPKQLWAPLQVPAADTLIYTSPGGQKGTRIQGLIIVNTSSAPVTIRITHGAMGEAQALCWDFSVPADGLPHDLMDGAKTILMDASDVLRAEAAAAASLTLHGYGLEMN